MKNFAALIESADKSELQLLLSAIEKKLKLGGGSDADAGVLAESEGVLRSLDTGQLSALGSSFSAWQAAAKTPTQRRSRSRIWLAYLLFRHGGLRLGEVMGLDDKCDFDFDRSLVRIAGQAARTVQMPADVMREIEALLNEPMFYSLRGEVLRIDPGYLRRKFYDQADFAGLPRDLVNPRVLRHSRGMELLNGGVPLKAVQFFLGQGGRGAGDGFGVLAPRTGQRIVQEYLSKEVKMKTSARNLFMGRVSHLVRDGILAEVELTTLSGLKIVAAITEESLENLGISEGSVITASVKAAWVVLAVPGPGEKLKASTRNQFLGKVAEVKRGKLASEVLVDLYEGSKMCSLITGGSAEQLELEPGVDVTVMFKSFSVILGAA